MYSEQAAALLALWGPTPGRVMREGGAVAKSNHPIDQAIRGPAAVWTGRRGEAELQFAQAKTLILGRTPSPEKPFADAGEHWSQRVLAVLLTAELKRSLAATP